MILSLSNHGLAQSYGDSSVVDKIERLERDIQTLQQKVYKGSPAPSALQEDGSSPRNEATLTLLEEQIRRLTGRIEELEYQNKTFVKTIDKLVDQPSYQHLEPASTSKTTMPISTIQNTQADMFLQENLRTLDTQNQKTTDPIKQEYENAFGLLRQAKFSEAETNLKTFISTHEEHSLTSNAYYWLGETYYVQKSYEQAAVQFLRGYKKFPKGNKATDSLLKLSMSLGNLEKNTEACTSLNKLSSEFPNASNAIKQRAEELAGSYNCQ